MLTEKDKKEGSGVYIHLNLLCFQGCGYVQTEQKLEGKGCFWVARLQVIFIFIFMQSEFQLYKIAPLLQPKALRERFFMDAKGSSLGQCFRINNWNMPVAYQLGMDL